MTLPISPTPLSGLLDGRARETRLLLERAAVGLALSALFGVASAARHGRLAMLVHAAGVPLGLTVAVALATPALCIAVAHLDLPLDAHGVGCAGDTDPNSIDLIVDVRGDGKTFGPGVDAFKVRLEAGYGASIQLTGHVDCGPRLTPTQHQDGVQLQGGRDISFVDFGVGDYEAGVSTCQGAGGAFFYSGASGYSPDNVRVIRGKYIACNHSLLAGNAQATGSVESASFRSGRTDGSDPVCVGYAGSKPCIGQASGVPFTGLTCQAWSSASKQWL